ncbi:MAG: hypothetical protein NZ898_04225 [Myxococcota bacterium]|nr:hypothetical protein [Myxococcota bacterium]MDW8362551.1 hypothetical protein [Myxococcales bacterium]
MRELSAVLLAAALVGCPRSSPAADASARDAPAADRPHEAGGADDADADGLCDETERRYGSDPTSVDTDGDGFPDYYEVVAVLDPTAPSEPPRQDVVVLTESGGSRASVHLDITVRGAGEDFQGAFESVWVPDVAGTTAAEFFEDADAIDAYPRENVAIIEGEIERFRGVVGRTRLWFELTFLWRDALERRCVRLYPFHYTVKRNDGVLVARPRRLLLVVPAGTSRPQPASWCAPPEAPCR